MKCSVESFSVTRRNDFQNFIIHKAPINFSKPMPILGFSCGSARRLSWFREKMAKFDTSDVLLITIQITWPQGQVQSKIKLKFD